MKKIFKPGKVSLTILMLVLALITIFPFIWMISSSFKPLQEIYRFPPQLISQNMTIDNYIVVLFEQNPSFFKYILNSLTVTVATVIGTILTSSMAGYAFAKLQFPFRNQLFLLYLTTMMVPFQVLMVPQFIQFRYMNILDTLWALILPRMFSPLSTFLMRQFYLNVPSEIIEAGRIDGAGEFRIFSSLTLPLVKPGMATVAILNFVWRWNEYEAPLIFINSKEKYTLPLGLTNFIDEAGFGMDNLIMAGACIALLPMLLAYIFGQRYITEGLTAGSVKG